MLTFQIDSGKGFFSKKIRCSQKSSPAVSDYNDNSRSINYLFEAFQEKGTFNDALDSKGIIIENACLHSLSTGMYNSFDST